MSRKSAEAETVRVHLMLFQEDWKFLMEQYDDNLGAGKAVRAIVKAKCDALRLSIAKRRDARAGGAESMPRVQGPGGHQET